jgi:hypothetical protein
MAKRFIMHTYDYHGFTLQVSVESGFSLLPNKRPAQSAGYVAVVRVFQARNAVAVGLVTLGDARLTARPTR